MLQTIELPKARELAGIEAKRAWVRDHYEPAARHQYDSVEGKLTLLETILANGWVDASQTLKLQCLGIALGDALSQHLGLRWVMIEDDYGRDPALELEGTSVRLFPETMISKRVEDGEDVDVRALFNGVCDAVADILQELSS